MGYLKKYRTGLKTGLLVGALLPAGCIGDADLTGFLYSSAGVNKRFEESINHVSALSLKPAVEATDTNAYAFMAIGDVHVGGTENLGLFLDKAAGGDALFFAIAGDLSTGKKEDMLVMKNFLNSHASVPYYPVTGNHDLYFDGWPSFIQYFGPSTYFSTVRCRDTSDLFIFLDSGSATLGKDQANWLKNLLKQERSNFRYCIIVTHTNLFRSRRTTSTNPLVDELYFLMDLCIDYNIDMVITGHDHRHSEEQFGHTTFVILDALLDGYKYASYLKLEVSEQGIDYQFFSVNP